MGSFNEKVWLECRKIPRGKVSTYSDIAFALGSPNAARAVGNALNKNPDTKRTPCHRVIKSNGLVGGYALGVKRKIALLKKEGVKVSSSGKVDLKGYLFRC